jgi:hypothetical protein
MEKKLTSIWIVLKNTFISLTNGTIKWNLIRLVSMLLKLATIDPPRVQVPHNTKHGFIYLLSLQCELGQLSSRKDCLEVAIEGLF